MNVWNDTSDVVAKEMPLMKDNSMVSCDRLVMSASGLGF